MITKIGTTLLVGVDSNCGDASFQHDGHVEGNKTHHGDIHRLAEEETQLDGDNNLATGGGGQVEVEMRSLKGGRGF